MNDNPSRGVLTPDERERLHAELRKARATLADSNASLRSLLRDREARLRIGKLMQERKRHRAR